MFFATRFKCQSPPTVHICIAFGGRFCASQALPDTQYQTNMGGQRLQSNSRSDGRNIRRPQPPSRSSRVLTEHVPGGFGSSNNTTSLFGNTNTANKPAFGSAASTGGNMFGSTQTGTTGGFGGFGSTGSNTSSGFSFGAKPSGFGSTPATTNAPTTSLFGGGNTGTSAFGSNTNTNTFGASGTALSAQGVPPCQGTGSVPFAPHVEKDGNGPVTNHFQTISFMPPYQAYSLEVSIVQPKIS